MNALRESLTGLEDRIERRMLAAEERIDRRMLASEERIDRRFVTLDDKVDRLSARMSQQFFFLVGLQITTIAGIVTAMLKR